MARLNIILKTVGILSNNYSNNSSNKKGVLILKIMYSPMKNKKMMILNNKYSNKIYNKNKIMMKLT